MSDDMRHFVSGWLLYLKDLCNPADVETQLQKMAQYIRYFYVEREDGIGLINVTSDNFNISYPYTLLRAFGPELEIRSLWLEDGYCLTMLTESETIARDWHGQNTSFSVRAHTDNDNELTTLLVGEWNQHKAGWTAARYPVVIRYPVEAGKETVKVAVYDYLDADTLTIRTSRWVDFT